MISLESTLLDFIDDRLDHMLEAPEMWGSYESVELQILQLLEVRSLVVAPALEPSSWQQVQAAYERLIAARFPGAAPTTLSTLLDQRVDEMMPLLSEFVADQRCLPSPEDLADKRNAFEIDKIELIIRMVRTAVENEGQRNDTYGQRAIEFDGREVA